MGMSSLIPAIRFRQKDHSFSRRKYSLFFVNLNFQDHVNVILVFKGILSHYNMAYGSSVLCIRLLVLSNSIKMLNFGLHKFMDYKFISPSNTL